MASRPSPIPAAEAGIRAHHVNPPTITVDDIAWRRLIPAAESVARRAAAAANGASIGAESVVLTSDGTVQRLNARHRGQNKPTNVLTFEGAGHVGGEIILSLGAVRREAEQAGKRPADHLAHLVVHGALHLQGHDHHHPGDARRMEMAEARIMRRLGRPNPWRRA